ncbi:hypothetical protein KX928_07950 [Roseobacter sp. YSTF-M11]|uniref:YfdX protein n=1 Tax=Roseobacter insulae TaxID=2859783 RepID=A0A9X1FUR6_9RHOB|nr:hypothetical protein [Roseobacter insulae]MBW4707717.1 hypothetical protein [Roseobacter insulae]
MTYLKIGASAFAISAFVLAPAVVVVTAEPGYAKSENAGGNGNGGGNGGGNKGGGQKGSDGNKGKSVGKGGDKSRGKSAARGSFKSDVKALGRDISRGFGLFGDKSTKSATRKPGKSVRAPATSPKPPSRPDKTRTADAQTKGALHPSNLGKLNGAINASPNAKAAHIANGNFNGPVGIAAALALADYNLDAATGAYAAAQDALDLAEALTQAQALIDNAPTAQETEAAKEILADPSATQAEIAAATETLAYPDTTEAAALIAGTPRPDDEALAEAQAIVHAGPPDADGVITAETAVLDAYKGTLTEEDAAKVLDAVRAANPTDDAIAAALAKGEPTKDGAGETDVPQDTDSAMAKDTPPDQG